MTVGPDGTRGPHVKGLTRDVIWDPSRDKRTAVPVGSGRRAADHSDSLPSCSVATIHSRRIPSHSLLTTKRFFTMAIPVAMYGPDPKMAESIGQNLAPEYEGKHCKETTIHSSI
jgi:hypothetical protein